MTSSISGRCQDVPRTDRKISKTAQISRVVDAVCSVRREAKEDWGK
jgi:hypothetical protein